MGGPRLRRLGGGVGEPCNTDHFLQIFFGSLQHSVTYLDIQILITLHSLRQSRRCCKILPCCLLELLRLALNLSSCCSLASFSSGPDYVLLSTFFPQVLAFSLYVPRISAGSSKLKPDSSSSLAPYSILKLTTAGERAMNEIERSIRM